MKNTFLTLTFLTLLSSNSFAGEKPIPLPDSNFKISTEDVSRKYEVTLQDIQGLLNQYRPEGAKITKKKVNNDTISFVATKSKYFIDYDVNVKAQLYSVVNNQNCKDNENGQQMVLTFKGSDDIVTDNIDRLEFTICTYETSENELVGSVKTKMYKGNDYSSLVGEIAQQVIAAQVSPLIRAMKEKVTSAK